METLCETWALPAAADREAFENADAASRPVDEKDKQSNEKTTNETSEAGKK
jgi:hypothetical protein